MKKFLSVFIVLGFACSTHAQLVVDSLGRVGVGTQTTASPITLYGATSSPVMKIYQRGGASGLQVNSIQFSNSRNPMSGIDVQGIAATGKKYIGINSHIRKFASSLPLTTVGVLGESTGSQCNIGIFGKVSPNDTASFCAGIMGYVGNVGNVPSTQSKGIYAGYFLGSVRVTGRLYGTLYSLTGTPSTSVQTQALSMEDGESVSDKLLSVQTVQFVNEEEKRRYTASIPSTNSMNEKNNGEVSLSEVTNSDDILEEDKYQTDDTEVEEQIETEAVKHYGLDGEQLKAVFPELVAEDSQGNYHINYSEMVPLLLQSIRELKAEVDELKGNNGVVVQKSKAMAMPMSVDEAGTATDIVRMSQNKPNPFSESSVITLNVPDGAKAASIFIYDLSGKQVKSIPVDQRGETDITVYASDLQEGMFVYSLVVDGTVASTRRMMVVKN